VHVAVNDLAQSIRFYSTVFGAAPTVAKPDYAKWLIDDPRINFAISTRGWAPGINHLGLQVDSDDELRAMHARLAAADAGLVEETAANCCYAKSDKYWVRDPQGIAWETYRTLGDIPFFAAEASTDGPAACCAPAAQAVGAKVPLKARPRCC